MFTHNRLLMEKRNTVKMACRKQFLHTYLECRYTHDKENIFVSLVKYDSFKYTDKGGFGAELVSPMKHLKGDLICNLI